MRLDPRQIEVVDEEMARVLRRMTGAQRLRIASQMFSTARRGIVFAIQAEHPDWNRKRVNERAARTLSRMVGKEWPSDGPIA
jgi:hypothetical protein